VGEEEEAEAEEEDKWYVLDQVPTTLHLVRKAFQKTKEVVAEKQVLLDEMEMKKTKEIEGGCDESQIVQHCRSHRVARL
jgi:hypothetical protein